MLDYVFYTSTATSALTQTDLDELAHWSQEHNQVHGITGLLIYDNQNFLQILEGESDSVNRLMRNIAHDSRNANLIILKQEPLLKRNFPAWYMRVSDVSAYTDKIKQALDFQGIEQGAIEQPDKYLSLIIELLDTVLKAEFERCHQSAKKETQLSNNNEVKLFRQLSQREKEVLRLLVKGLTAKGIARSLNISDKTAARHTENIRKQLDCISKSDLIMKVFSSGYLHELLAEYFEQ